MEVTSEIETRHNVIPTMGRSDRFFRYDNLDAFPTIAALTHLGLIVFTAFFYDALPLPVLALLFLVIAFCYCWNLQAISHNFIHNEYFGPAWLNRAFSYVETLALGVPHAIVWHQHWNHHSGDNDKKGADGKTKDWVSTYRYGKGDKPEAFWAYCLLSHARFPLIEIAQIIVRRGRRHTLHFVAECLMLTAFVVFFGLLNWRYLVYYYLPCYYFGWVLVYAENYFLHYGATEPGNRYANSVSSYHRFYNWVFFNNSYHQEHHSTPKIHWTLMPQVRDEIRPQMVANNTRIIRGPHATILFETWWDKRKGRTPLRADQTAIVNT